MGRLLQTSEPQLHYPFQVCQSEGCSGCHNGTEEKNLASREVILKIAPVLVHQAPLLVRHVLHERGARRNQFEVVVLLCHGREILAADAQCWRSLSIPRAHIAAWAR